jgi:hypothetical protein
VTFPGRRFFGDGVGPGLFLGFFCLRRWVGLLGFAVASGLVLLLLRWHPRLAFVLQALPLCGAAPTFLCRRKEK